MEEKRNINKQTLIQVGVAAAIVAAAILTGITLGRYIRSVKANEVVEISPMEIKQLIPVREMKVMTVYQELKVKYESGKVKLVAIYPTRLQLGFDLAKCDTNWIEKRHDTIFVTLPPVEVLNANMQIVDEAAYSVPIEKNKPKNFDMTRMRNMANSMIIQQCKADGLMYKAAEQGKEVMTALINTFSGMENVVVVVNVKQHDDLEDPGADWYSDDPETVATKLNLNPLYPTLKDTKGIVLHKGFALEYDDTHEQPRWVFYRLTKEQAKAKHNLTNDFRPDPDVFKGSATLEDYLESGYYRGQLCPPTDMAWDAACMSETFLLSNASPMDKKFRNSIWADCEKTINKWAQKHDSLYVVSGPVLRLGLNTIGASCVSVPEYFYKVVYDPARLQGIAVLVPNQKSNQAMKKFVVTIDSVETLTGIDFFPSLPDEVEQKVEGVSNFKNW